MAFRLRRGHGSILIFSGLAMASAARAQTAQQTLDTPERLNYSVDAGLGETDNVTLSPTNKVAQTMATADVDFDVRHKSSRLDVEAKGSFTDYSYLEGAFGNQVLGRIDGLGHFALVPQRLTWALQEDFGQAALDPFTPQTPNNLENINYVSTGPDLALKLGGTGFFDMSLRAARADYSTSPFTSNRFLGSVGGGVDLSARSSISINGVAERVLFQNTIVNGDFDRSSAYLRYEVQAARTGFSADLGETKVRQSASQGTSALPVTPSGLRSLPEGASSTTGPLARIELSRKMSSAATLTLTGGRELTDASSSFSSIQGGNIALTGTVAAVLTTSTYTSNFGSAGWQYQRNLTSIGVSAHYERDLYRSQPQFDLTRGSIEAGMDRQLNRAFSLQVLARYSKTNYFNDTQATFNAGTPQYNDATVGAALVWRHGRALEIRLRAEHSSRTNPGPTDFGYQETRGFLTVGYSPEGHRFRAIPGMQGQPGFEGPNGFENMNGFERPDREF